MGRGNTVIPVRESAGTSELPHCVVLIHGALRTERSMRGLATYATSRGQSVVTVDYPARAAGLDIRELADTYIPPALASCPEGRKLDVVTHSMGGLLLRDYVGRHPELRVGRVVMFAPPNQGSQVTDRVKHWLVYQWLYGPAGQELGSDQAATMAPIPFEVGIIAGVRHGWLAKFIFGNTPNDGKVAVEDTKITGMKDFLIVDTDHDGMLRNPEVIAQAWYFLQHGAFKPGPVVQAHPASRTDAGISR